MKMYCYVELDRAKKQAGDLVNMIQKLKDDLQLYRDHPNFDVQMSILKRAQDDARESWDWLYTFNPYRLEES